MAGSGPAACGEGREAAEAAGLHPLVAVKLWQNPCWLSFRMNFLSSKFNHPVYAWVERQHGLTRPEMVVLYALGLKDGLAAKDVSQSSAFPKNTISRAVQVLEERRLIRRATDAADRRSFVLRLTPRGRAMVDEALPLMIEREREMLAALTPAEQRQLHALLTKLVVASPGWNAACDAEESS